MVSLSFQVNEMKVSLPFHVFFFIGVITFSMPVATIAQQNSGTLETRANVVEDASTLWMEAKAAAEQDASSDTNKILWFGAGFATFAIGCPLGGCIGCCIGSVIDPSYFYDSSSTVPGLGGIVGLTVGVLTPLVSIYRYQPHPPPKRLIGKSPEYVEFYTHAYKAKTQLLRTKLAAVGAVTGCGLMMLGCLVSVVEW